MKSTAIILVLTSLLYSTTAALPNGQAFLATFDTINEFYMGMKVPTPYANLSWNNFWVAYGVAFAANPVIILPHSNPVAALGGLSGFPTSNFTVDYPDSPIKAFDLVSAWVACVSSENLPPEKCLVRFTGYKAHKARHNGTGSFRSVYDYAFSGGDVMEFVTFPESFRRLSTVDVVITVNGSAQGQAFQLDDVKGVVYRW